MTTTLDGLTEAEASIRRERDGLNLLTEKKPRPAWKKFLDQFKDLLVVVLIGAAILAGAVGDLSDAVVILAVIVFNASLGFYQEHRAEMTLAALTKMLAQHARVMRGGCIAQIDAKDLVVGDVVLLDAGDRIPADGRVVEAHDAEVAEAALTGESLSVSKQPDALASGDHPLAERSNMVFMNTVVTRGRMKTLVTAIGMKTEMGRISTLLESTEESPTPLQIQLDGLGKTLAMIAGLVVTIVFAIGVLRGDPVVQTIMISVALAVAAIPEGLPAVVTITLAIGMRRMAKNHAIVKKLAAVETLGATSVICSDKTGTLTLNEMTARKVLFRGRELTVSGEGYSGKGSLIADDGLPLPDLTPMLVSAALCNESSIENGKLIGDPTEGALLALAIKGGLEPGVLAKETPRIAEIPFDSAQKFMATFHRGADGAQVTMLLKGAPGVLLGLSSQKLGVEGETVLDDTARQAVIEASDRLARLAMRVLGLARREIPAAQFDPAGDLGAFAKELTFTGLVGMSDPPRPEARDAIARCKSAGIQVKMITGDHRLTASAIARELNLDGAVLSGAELDELDDAALSRQVEATAVFARVAPEHKVRIVKALKARGLVVAMTGDGVNDAPALKCADIGVAMGVTGTEVAKEAASMVITDDNFVTILGAVNEGRTIYENIVKFVRFQLSTNIGAILTVLGAQMLGLPTPLTAIQILWINIIMDGPPAMTLGLEPARPGAMDEPPRKTTARILTAKRFGHLLAFGAIMATGTLGMFTHGLASGSREHAMTLAFTTFVLFQIFNVLNARAEQGTMFHRQFFANYKLWGALAAVAGCQVLVVHLPVAQRVFHTSHLAPFDWAKASLVAVSILVFDEARKLTVRLWKSPAP